MCTLQWKLYKEYIIIVEAIKFWSEHETFA